MGDLFSNLNATQPDDAVGRRADDERLGGEIRGVFYDHAAVEDQASAVVGIGGGVVVACMADMMVKMARLEGGAEEEQHEGQHTKGRRRTSVDVSLGEHGVIIAAPSLHGNMDGTRERPSCRSPVHVLTP